LPVPDSPLGDGTNGTYNPDLQWMEPKEQRKVDPFIVYAVGAADMALADAGWHPETDEDQIRPAFSSAPASAASKALSRPAIRCATRARAAFLPSSFPAA
jgi:3-oxoacyl-(acyl-carrier-protein) synthase